MGLTLRVKPILDGLILKVCEFQRLVASEILLEGYLFEERGSVQRLD